MGMVNRVVAEAELGETALAMAQQIAKAPPFGLRLIKRSINRSLDAQGMRTALQAHFDTHQLSHLSEGFLTARDRGLAKAIQKMTKAGIPVSVFIDADATQIQAALLQTLNLLLGRHI